MAIVILHENFEVLSEENRKDNIVTQTIAEEKILDYSYCVRNMGGAEPAENMLLWANATGRRTVPVIHMEILFEEYEVSEEYIDEAFSIGSRMMGLFGDEFQSIFALHMEDEQIRAHLLVNAVSMHYDRVMHISRMLADTIFCHAFKTMREFNLDTFKCLLL